MNEFLDELLRVTTASSGWLWGVPMVALLFGTGVLLSVATKFVQIRHFRESARLILRGAFHKKDAGEKEGEGDITPFQALMTALSATVGNGNIAGVATAIAAGGPGAAFWMWTTALFGMATKYAEAVLAILYRRKMEDGSMAGGPMYYCKHGLGLGRIGAFLGAAFALCGGLTAIFGNMFQPQSMALAVRQQFSLPQWLTGLAISLLVGLVIIGGIRRIGAVAERLVPMMILFYFAGALLVIGNHLDQVPGALRLILVSAFDPQAAFGGAVGIGFREAVRFGVARGMSSNESGLGSAAIAHGAARTRDPVRQGGIAMMGTFIDTIVVCTLTALTITVSGAYKQATFMVEGIGLSGADLTVTAFNTGMPSFLSGYGGVIVACCSLIFGFTTLLGWAYYGQICFEFLFGLKSVPFFQGTLVLAIFLGALVSGPWVPIIPNISDICNAFMAFPNLIALLFLSRKVAQITRQRPLMDPGSQPAVF